jgi:hypothetical protein
VILPMQYTALLCNHVHMRRYPDTKLLWLSSSSHSNRHTPRLPSSDPAPPLQQHILLYNPHHPCNRV